MFLKPTAKPTPRRTPSPRVVFPAPPGRRIASRGSSSGSGSGMRGRAPDDLARRERARHDLPGRERAARLERVQEPQLDGSMPSSAASRSICASAAKHVCTAPKPRIAPHGGLFV